ncbi:MAG: hypothetical protein J5I94_11010 [Phaeodactylibacter sp.]|nr:hypothetical protein [Phaeodactylibacter sp.]
MRGGSWNNNTNNLRSSNRNRNNPNNRNNNNGFRLAQRYAYSRDGVFARIHKVTALWSVH